MLAKVLAIATFLRPILGSVVPLLTRFFHPDTPSPDGTRPALSTGRVLFAFFLAFMSGFTLRGCF